MWSNSTVQGNTASCPAQISLCPTSQNYSLAGVLSHPLLLLAPSKLLGYIIDCPTPNLSLAEDLSHLCGTACGIPLYDSRPNSLTAKRHCILNLTNFHNCFKLQRRSDKKARQYGVGSHRQGHGCRGRHIYYPWEELVACRNRWYVYKSPESADSIDHSSVQFCGLGIKFLFLSSEFLQIL